MFRFRVQSWKPSTIFVRLDFLKCVQNSFSSQRKSVQKVCQDCLVSTQICTMTRKSRHTFCTDLRLEENENLNTLEKIWTDRNCWGFLSQDFIFLNATYQMLKYFINLDSIKMRLDQQENWQGMKRANQTDYHTYIYSIIYIYPIAYGTAVMKKLSYL